MTTEPWHQRGMGEREWIKLNASQIYSFYRWHFWHTFFLVGSYSLSRSSTDIPIWYMKFFSLLLNYTQWVCVRDTYTRTVHLKHIHLINCNCWRTRRVKKKVNVAMQELCACTHTHTPMVLWLHDSIAHTHTIYISRLIEKPSSIRFFVLFFCSFFNRKKRYST